MDAITAEGLVKIYRTRKSEVRALDGVDLNVPEGTVLLHLERLRAARVPAGLAPAIRRVESDQHMSR